MKNTTETIARHTLVKSIDDDREHSLENALERVISCLHAHLEGRHQLLKPIGKLSEKTPLHQLKQRFNLSEADLQVLLLCAAFEVDPTVGVSIAYPTPHLIGELLNHEGKRALSPSGALRYWAMIDRDKADISTAVSVLRLDERILNYLMGINCLDDRLVDVFEPAYSCLAALSVSQKAVVNSMTSAFDRSTPTFQLCGIDAALKTAIVSHFCKQSGLTPYRLIVEALPQSQQVFRLLLRLWQREVKLKDYVLVIDWDQANGSAELQGYLSSLVKTAKGPTIVTTSERIDLPAQAVFTAVVESPTPAEQRLLWTDALKNYESEKEDVVRKLVSQFNLTTANIQSAATYVSAKTDPEQLERDLWQACRIQARPQLDALCQRIEAKETWEDLVLPEQQKQILQMIIAHNRERATVYEEWGFTNKSSRGLGTSALFSGQSGTGKTMAANVIAQQLNLDLYKVDLSTVVSKYIGETEKNLKRIFDAAETGGVILLFDEADAIFGKRSEVRDARDRYANMEVSYLLQRMESYRGLAILTTNMKDNIDKAFLRRIRFITTFPFPDYKQRYEIWQRVFPTNVPTKGLDYFKLADLDAAGGNIRSVALSAAFLAASEKDEENPNKRASVTMERILRAARLEFNKLDQPLPLGDPKSWLEET